MTASTAKLAVIDSGTSLLAGPTSEVAAIAKKAGATLVLGKEWMIDCKANVPDLVFKFSGELFTLTKEDLIINISGQCLFGMMGIDMPKGRSPMWIVGDVFMRK